MSKPTNATKMTIEAKLRKLEKLEKEEKSSTRAFAVRSLQARADSKRNFGERIADWVTAVFGSIPFLTINIVTFAGWIAVNVGMIPGIEPFDPYPFGFLTMCVSLEAIFLAILVLLSQNRQAHIGELREEIDLHINKISEAEITQIIKMLAQVLEKNGVDTKNDIDIQRMLRPLSSEDIQRKLERQSAKNGSLINLPKLPMSKKGRS